MSRESRRQAKADAAAAKAAYKASRPVYRKKRYWLLVLILIVIIAVASAGSSGTNSIVGNHSGAPLSEAQQAAQQYLQSQPFSKQGLIDQLASSAGSQYPQSTATQAVNSLHVDWNKEAVQAAQQYLQSQPFSCNALIEQLASSAGSKFTQSQAVYGAHHTKACS
jgi:flagellar basal body-associated protein FliL